MHICGCKESPCWREVRSLFYCCLCNSDAGFLLRTCNKICACATPVCHSITTTICCCCCCELCIPFTILSSGGVPPRRPPMIMMIRPYVCVYGQMIQASASSLSGRKVKATARCVQAEVVRPWPGWLLVVSVRVRLLGVAAH